MSRIAILGAGAWGTALALSLTRRDGHEIILWSHSPAHAAELAATRTNTKYLPGFTLPASLQITGSVQLAADNAELLVFVTPSEHLRATMLALAPSLRADHSILSAAKGLENVTFMRTSQVIAEVTTACSLQLPIAVLSGPSFAQEVAADMPTAVTVASKNAALAQHIQREFSSSSLRLYTNDDVIGVELGGALKNVVALSAGIVSGLGLGYNTSAALITRGIAEITRLAIACGGRPQTLAGLSGMGDLVLTCTGSLSRNRSAGIELGMGRTLPEVLAGLHGRVAEGIHTTAAALGLARTHGVEMPITEQMDAILNHGKPPMDAIRDLMSRPGRDE